MSVTGLTTGLRQRLRPAMSRARSVLARHDRSETAGSVHIAPVDAPPAVALAPATHDYQQRQVLVVSDLGMLRGPVSGTVTLPLDLHWSGAKPPAYNLDDPRQRPALYRTVLREALDPSQLVTLINGDLLVDLWPRLVLPPAVRAAWEEQHPRLLQARAVRLRPAG